MSEEGFEFPTEEIDGFGEASLVFAERAAGFYGRLQHSLHRVGAHIVATAQGMMGHYQDAIGPFPQWPELADSTKEDRLRLGFTEDDPLLRSGELRDSIEYDVDGLDVYVGSPDFRMAIHEFGTNDATIPARPVLGPAVFMSKEVISRIVGRAAISAFCGRDPVHVALGYNDETAMPPIAR